MQIGNNIELPPDIFQRFGIDEEKYTEQLRLLKDNIKRMVLIPKMIAFNKQISGWQMIPNHRKPIVYCPKCGRANIGDFAPHGVRANGEVYQSMVCAHNDCDFHEFVKLEDWGGEEIPHD